MATSLKKQRRAAAGKLKADIIRQIEEGELHPGDMIRPAAELAETYGISYVTVHKAFQELVKDGYCRRVARQGTFVSDNPPICKISFVGIPAYYPSNPFHAHMIEELTIQAAAHRIHAVVGRAESTVELVKRLLKMGIRAMIRFPGTVSDSDTTETDIWQLLQKEGFATVMVNDFWREGGPFPHVRTDEAAGISEMMDHLVGLGHKRILLVMETVEGMRPGMVAAHREAFERHGLPYDSKYVFPLFPEWGHNKEKMLQWMLDEATAAIVCYDVYALELAAEFDRMGVVVGADFSVAGFDGIPAAEAYGLSTVAQPITELASTAFTLLENASLPEVPKLRLKPTCVFRDSTGPAPEE